MLKDHGRLYTIDERKGFTADGYPHMYGPNEDPNLPLFNLLAYAEEETFDSSS